MNRRRFLVGFTTGTLATGWLVGSSAFSNVEAERAISVEVAHDIDAYLALHTLGIGDRVFHNGDVIQLRIPGSDELIANSDIGLGVDSTYDFVYDSGEDDTPGLIRIENNGTKPVLVFSEPAGGMNIDVKLFDVYDPNRQTLRESPAELEPGDHVDVGIRVETFEVTPDSIEATMTVRAVDEDTFAEITSSDGRSGR